MIQYPESLSNIVFLYDTLYATYIACCNRDWRRRFGQFWKQKKFEFWAVFHIFHFSIIKYAASQETPDVLTNTPFVNTIAQVFTVVHPSEEKSKTSTKRKNTLQYHTKY